MQAFNHTSFLTAINDLTQEGELLHSILKKEEAALENSNNDEINHINELKQFRIKSYISMQKRFAAIISADKPQTFIECAENYINEAPTHLRDQLQLRWQEWLQQKRDCSKQNQINSQAIIKKLQLQKSRQKAAWLS